MAKRIIALFLSLIAAFNIIMLTACSSNDSDDNSSIDENNGNNSDNNNGNDENGNDGNVTEGTEEYLLSKKMLESAFGDIRTTIDSFLSTYGDQFPGGVGKNNVYPLTTNTGGWITGFWTGILWNAYELTGNSTYKNVATDQVDSFYYRIENKIGVNHHDMGFLYSPSCVAAYQLTGNEKAREAAIMAADHLLTRYHEKGEFIQAWGNVGDPESYKLIVDCLMNIPLLYWATEETGDPHYRDCAEKHLKTTIRNCIREDGSTYQVYQFDTETGEPIRGMKRQGVDDESTWSRGQAWTMYGTIIAYSYTKDEETLEAFKKATAYYLENLPADYVPYWDFNYSDGDYEPKDSSAASTAVCALLEAIEYLDENDPLRKTYIDYIDKIMYSLITNYASEYHHARHGFLLHATQDKPGGGGIDETNLWGDYFYAEALNRMLKADWEKYW